MANIFISPDGNPEVWENIPERYFTPEEWAEAHPPEKVEVSFDAAIAQKIASINRNTKDLIVAGFDYEIDGQSYHFGYDETDQANFTKGALSATIALTQGDDSFRQSWRGWIADEPYTLSLTASGFLALATYAGKEHQEKILSDGWQIQEVVRAMTDADEVLNFMDPRMAR